MADATPPDRVLVTVTGPDRTGVTSTLTGILAEQGASLYDIEQVVVQGQLTLCLLVGIPGNRDVLKELLFAAKQLGMDLDFKPVAASAPSPAPAGEGRCYVITAIAPSLGPEAPARARVVGGGRGRQHRKNRAPLRGHAHVRGDPRLAATRA